MHACSLHHPTQYFHGWVHSSLTHTLRGTWCSFDVTRCTTFFASYEPSTGWPVNVKLIPAGKKGPNFHDCLASSSWQCDTHACNANKHCGWDEAGSIPTGSQMSSADRAQTETAAYKVRARPGCQSVFVRQVKRVWSAIAREVRKTTKISQVSNPSFQTRGRPTYSSISKPAPTPDAAATRWHAIGPELVARRSRAGRRQLSPARGRIELSLSGNAPYVATRPDTWLPASSPPVAAASAPGFFNRQRRTSKVITS